jgi:hypothetical protein
VQYINAGVPGRKKLTIVQGQGRSRVSSLIGSSVKIIRDSLVRQLMRVLPVLSPSPGNKRSIECNVSCSTCWVMRTINSKVLTARILG